MISKRIGHWSWSLSPDERKTAAAVIRRQREQTSIATRLKRKHDAMLEKQRKIEGRERRLDEQGVTLLGASRSRFRGPNISGVDSPPSS